MSVPTFLQMAVNTQAMGVASAGAPATKTADSSGFSFGAVFHDLLDIVNPLQHLPVIGTLYRAITGDKLGTVEKLRAIRFMAASGARSAPLPTRPSRR